MLERLPRAKRNLALAVIGLVVLAFAWSIRPVLNPLLVGYLLAYILHPIVQRIQGRRLSHRAAVNTTFLVGGIAFLLIGTTVVYQGSQLVTDVVTDDTIRQDLADKWGELRVALVDFGVDEELVPEKATLAVFMAELRERVVAFYESHQETAHEAAVEAGQMGVAATRGVWNALRRLVGAVFGIGGMLLLVPLYTYYLLFELGRLHGFVGRYLPHRDRAHISRVGGQIGEVLANFFRGRLLVCLIKGVIMTVGLKIAGIQYPFLIGMGSGFLSLIPVFGPFIGFVLAFLLGALDYSLVSTLIRTGIVFGVAEVVEGYVLIPKILGDSLGLHPVVVLFALLAGGAALGLFGVLVALPLTASIVILVREFVLPALARFADEVDESPIVLADGDDPSAS